MADVLNVPGTRNPPAALDAPGIVTVPGTLGAPGTVNARTPVDAPSHVNAPTSLDMPAGPDTSEAELPAAALPHPRRSWRFRRLLLALNVAAVAVALAAWWAATRFDWVAPVFLPAPGDVLHAARVTFASGDLLTDIAVSARRVFLGFALAAIVAVPLGVVMGVWQPAKAVMDPFVSLLRPLPSITWIPLSILWLGIGESQKVAIVFMGSWIYILLYTYESTRRIDPLLLRAARNLGASDLAIMWEVILPGSLPGIITGLKVTLAISWSCVLSAEMIAAQNGLGALIWQAKDWGNMPLVLVGMLCISLTVLVADWLMLRIERALLPWERGRRG